MLKVSYKIKIGSTTIAEGKPTSLLEVRSHSCLQIPSNSCRIVLSSPNDLAIKPDDSVAVELGYEGKTALVFTGKVSTVDWEIDRVKINSISSIASLTTAHFNSLYEQSNAGDVVKDILKKSKLTPGKIESGLKYSTYALGDRASAYDCLQTLAQQCNFGLYANVEDKIVFASDKAASTHQFSYGENILAFSLEQPHIGVQKVEIYGESPASRQGEKASSWLTKKEVKGSAGSGIGATLRVSDPTARTQAIAQKIAKSKLANIQFKSRGKVKVLGNSQVKLTDAIKTMKMPVKQQNGTFKVIGVSHRLDRRQGFCTIIDWEEN